MAAMLGQFVARISQCCKMVTWGSIMVHIPQEKSDRVNDGPCQLSMEYRKEHVTPLQRYDPLLFIWLSCWPIFKLN